MRGATPGNGPRKGFSTLTGVADRREFLQPVMSKGIVLMNVANCSPAERGCCKLGKLVNLKEKALPCPIKKLNLMVATIGGWKSFDFIVAI